MKLAEWLVKNGHVTAWTPPYLLEANLLGWVRWRLAYHTSSKIIPEISPRRLKVLGKHVKRVVEDCNKHFKMVEERNEGWTDICSQ